ncbi:MAG: hypothetical protein ACTSWR_01865 [Candidatus Helarchaeota archaeon]
MKNNNELMFVAKSCIHRIKKKLENNCRLRFNPEKKNELDKLLHKLEVLVSDDIELVFPILMDLHIPSKLYGFEMDLNLLLNSYVSEQSKIIGHKNISSVISI